MLQHCVWTYPPKFEGINKMVGVQFISLRSLGSFLTKMWVFTIAYFVYTQTHYCCCAGRPH